MVWRQQKLSIWTVAEMVEMMYRRNDSIPVGVSECCERIV